MTLRDPDRHGNKDLRRSTDNAANDSRVGARLRAEQAYCGCYAGLSLTPAQHGVNPRDPPGNPLPHRVVYAAKRNVYVNSYTHA